MSDKKITAYKAFNKDMTCRGFQYEVGKSYKHDGDVEICDSGFHACLNPLDCLNYYDVIDSRFAEVELTGETKEHGGDTKIASAEITIKAELTLPDFIKRAIDWVFEAVKGKDSEMAASGYNSQLAASGDDSKLAASGNYSQLAASGNYSQLAASGNYSKLAASGDYSQLAASGYNSQLAASGDDSKLAASGDDSQLAASGYNSQLAASGNYSQLAASGDDSKLAASGDDSKLAASGDDSQLAASGDDCIISSSGINSRAKGKNGTWISLAEFNDNYKCIGFAVGCIGKDGLKEDVYYKAENGKLVEA